jgi:WhiB family redox-sensing transcriptional regulator
MREMTERQPDVREPDVFDTAWQAAGACRGADTRLFFPVNDDAAAEAKAICAGCPVVEECREWAIATRQRDGVWGGLTGIERHRLVRRRQKAARKARAAAAEAGREAAA